MGTMDIQKYAPGQARDERGRFASGGYSRASIAHDLRQPDGGFTVNPRTNTAASGGYAVSPYPKRSRPVENVGKMTDAEIGDAISSYMADNGDLLAKPKHFMGGWHDPQTGTVWLDVSIVEDTAEAAAATGKAHDQIAYFDLQTFESVDIDRNATSGQG